MPAPYSRDMTPDEKRAFLLRTDDAPSSGDWSWAVHDAMVDLLYREDDPTITLSAEMMAILDDHIVELVWARMGLLATLERLRRIRPRDRGKKMGSAGWAWDRLMDAMVDENGDVYSCKLGDVEFRVTDKHAEPECASFGIFKDGEMIAHISIQDVFRQEAEEARRGGS